MNKKTNLGEIGIATVENVGTVENVATVGASNARHQKEKLQQAGITLVALVVTIIVLLILAGVTLTLALSNNGVMTRAQHASNTWANATKDEETAMGQFASDVDTLTEGFISASDTYTGFGTVNENYKNLIGHIVDGYGVEGTWRLFYVDSNYAYLIRNIVYEDDVKWIEFANSRVSTISELGKILNPKYTSWDLKTNSTDLNNNIKVVATLLDPENWSAYAEEGVAIWAIGSPTLELFIASYNATHSEQLNCSVPEGATGYSFSTSDLESNQLNFTMYCTGMGLASPSAIPVEDGNYIIRATNTYGRARLQNDPVLDYMAYYCPLACVPISMIDNGLTITEDY